ncbi:MAG: aspartate kinase [Polyangiaceae bacterium]|nr:aspartate kinase [Polyangiaceae bacterium]MBK8941456.1 aspartate kinase [Polyangiaceae bacterium]
MIVMKFGGSSVADRAQIEKVLGIVRAHANHAPLVVCSAHKGVTDGLVKAAREAAKGRLEVETVIAKQLGVARELGCDDALLAPLFDDLRSLLRGVQLVRELSARSLDYVSSFGERWSTRVIADLFSRSGLPADAHDVWDLGFVTDASFGQARPVPGYEQQMRDAVARLPAGRVPIVTGFIGKTADGEITTVGRNGSDLTATLVGAALGAAEVQIWSDTDGVMTADPRLVRSARNIPDMRFDEAAELAYFGSRMLHPATLLPAMAAKIPVRVLNTNRPEHAGTVIRGEAAPNPSPVTSIAYKERQLVLTLCSTRMFGEVGFLGRVFETCARHGVEVDMVTTSEVTVSLTANDRPSLERAADELAALGSVRIDEGRSILVIVGQHLAERPGLGAEVFGAIAEAGVNVEMISHAFGAINLSLVVRDADVSRTVAVLHRVLFEEARA